MILKKKIQIIFKNIGYSIFFFIYGRIKGVFSLIENNKIKIKKVFLSENQFYRIFDIPNSRIYTDAVSDAAFIIDNKIIEGPSFQYRNAKNQECKYNIVFEKGTPKLQKKSYAYLLSQNR